MRRRRFTENMRRCPDCKRHISISATNCPLCGCDIVLRHEQAEEKRLNFCQMHGLDPNSPEGILMETPTETRERKARQKERLKKEAKERVKKEKKERVKKEEEKERVKKEERERVKKEERERAEAKAKGLTYKQYLRNKRKQDDTQAIIFFGIIFVIVMMLSYC